MNFAAALFAPLLLVLPAVGAIERAAPAEEAAGADPSATAPADAHAWPAPPASDVAPGGPLARVLIDRVGPDDAWQVRIEQRMQIRIAPRAAMPVRPDMLVDMRRRDEPRELSEKKIGKCVSIAGIAGVQPDRSNRLLLYMRDRRLVSAELERSCRARDFYSGFYLARSADGKLCIDRDSLLSRSGMNCKLTRIRQLVEEDR